MKKTNALRLLDSHKISYETVDYSNTDAVSGKSVAQVLGESENEVFKTLVCKGKSEHYVFVIPVDHELDLKKAAFCADEKKIEMLPQKELLPLTGYVHGGCSPLGMKKTFKTFIDQSAKSIDKIYVSAGKIGLQVRLNPSDLLSIIEAEYKDLTKEK
ncbi:Cys-tRNA(Pro) deacylase [Peptoniphilus sp. GNH]|nr:YbaK/EbsC protein [Clostridiales bacterium KA00134]UHR02887.1 Cys-tRNA(Pro) deacylase [Peptoniphilus sp. GNH]